ncbi:hypothetical protein C3L33_09766, partial [Rhododendron williamsianum]
MEFLRSTKMAVMGFWLCLVGFLGKKESEDTFLQEPLLNGTSASNGTESNKSSGGEKVCPFTKANLFSILSFSWVGHLIGVGNKKALDLADVPQLDGVDNVKGAFPIFRSKLESDSGSGSRITTFKLVKALIFATKWELIECLSQRHWFFRLQQAGIRARAVLVAMIYNKGLSISCQSKQVQTSGEIINLMSVDAQRVSTLVGTCTIHYCCGDGGKCSAWEVAREVSGEDNEIKGTRMKATSEILRNMRILKLQAWEMKFFTFIRVWRNFRRLFAYRNPLESGKILSALATFRILQESIYNLPDTISIIAQTKVSLDRIASFLRLDDLQSDVVEKLPIGSSNTAIEVVDGNFSWDVSSPDPTLKDINISVSRGMRVAVCGTIGSGKLRVFTEAFCLYRNVY